MTYFVELIKDKSPEETICFLLKNGFMSATHIVHAEIYTDYKSVLNAYQFKKEPKAKMKAVYDTAIKYKRSVTQIYNIISEFKKLAI